MTAQEAAEWLERRAPFEANGSRDFGRGYMQAVRLLKEKAEKQHVCGLGRGHDWTCIHPSHK